MPSFNELTSQAKQFWATRSSRQRGLLLAGTGATVVMLVLFTRLIGTPDYKPLLSGLEAEDAQTLATQLDADGIPHQLSADGKTISVPADKLDAARLKVASDGSQHSGRMGFELFDKVSWGQTEFDQKVTYQRGLEGELERSIKTLKDVESARVHIVMPTDSVFLDKQRGAKASVILRLRGKGLPKEAVLAISRLVAGAVDELQPEDVSIVDADSARSLGLGHAGLEGGETGEGIETTLTQRLIATLEPVVGADKIRASVNIDHDEGSMDESQEKYDPSSSAVLSDQKSEERTGGNAALGVPGTASNTPSTKSATQPSTAPGQDGGPSSKTETAQYGVNKTITHTVEPAGRIERVTAAILVDDEVVKTVQGGKTTYSRRKRPQEQLDKIQQIAEAVIGFDAKRGDSISVQNMSFDSAAADQELPPPTWIEKTGKAVTDYSSLLRPIGLLVLFMMAYMFVLRPIQKQAFGQTQLASGGQLALGGGGGQGQLSPGTVDPAESNRRAAELKESTAALVKQKPVHTARVVQKWLREEQS
jgi:flagellar M-ring protein FliF